MSDVAIVGRGRMGSALAARLRERAVAVEGPLGRGDVPAAPVVLLCVPDRAIAEVAATLPAGVLAGHCSGATGLDALRPHERFSLHPMMTVPDAGARFDGVGCAVAASSAAAEAVARRLAETLAMKPFGLREEDRTTYHAALSMASNYLLTLEGAAERLLAEVEVDPKLLAPILTSTVENWTRLGARDALTGPVARGDEPTVARQRAAVQDAAPDLVEMFDVLTDATRALAAQTTKGE